MPVSRKIGSAFVQVATKGFAQVQSTFAQLRTIATAASKKTTIPVEATTKVSADTRPAQQQLSTLTKQLTKLHGTAIVEVAAYTGQAQKAIDSVKGKTVYVHLATVGDVAQQAQKQLTKIPKTAIATINVVAQTAEAQKKIGDVKGKQVFIQVATKGLEAAQVALAKIKNTPIVLKTGEWVNAFKAQVDRLTNVPVLGNIKRAFAFVNERYNDFLERRYGKAAPFVKYSGMAVDAALTGVTTALGKPIVIPGLSILGSAPAMLLLELNKLRKTAAAQRIMIGLAVAGQKAMDGAKAVWNYIKGLVGRGATIALNVKQAQRIENYVGQLQARLNATPLSLGLQIDTSRAKVIDDLRAKIAGIPRQKAVAIITEKIAATDAQLAKLKAQLKSLPNNKIIRAKIEVTQGLRKDLSNEIKNLGKDTDKAGQRADVAKEKFRSLGDSIRNIGSIATKSFIGGIAAMGGLLRMADPKGMEDLQVATAKVAIQLGRFFVPILREVTALMERFSNWLKSLTDAQRQQVLNWTKIALVVTGGVMVFSKLFGVLAGGMTLLGGFAKGLAFLGVATPIGWVLALSAALVGLFAVLGSGGQLGGAFAGIGSSLDGLVAAVRSAFARIAPVVRSIIDGLTPIITSLVRLLADTFTALVPVFTSVAETLLNAFRSMLPVMSQIVGAIVSAVRAVLPVFVNIVSAAASMFSRLVPLITSIMSGIVPIIEGILNVIIGVFRALEPVVINFITLTGRIFEGIAPIISRVVGIIGAIFQRIAPVIIRVVSVIGDVLGRVFGVITSLLPPIMAVVGQIVDTVASVLMPVIEVIGNVIGQVVDALAPIFNAIVATLTPIIQTLVAVIGAVVEALRPIVDAAMSVFNVLSEFLMPVFSALMVPIELLINVVQTVVGWLTTLFEAIGPIVSTLRDALQPAFDFLGTVIRTIAGAFRTVINAIIDMINGFVDWYNDQAWLPGYLNRVRRMADEDTEYNGASGEWDGADEETNFAGSSSGGSWDSNNNFRGEVRREAPQLIGIAEAWKKLQTSQSEDPATRIAREQLAESRGIHHGIDEIVANTSTDFGWSSSGGDF